MNFFCFAHILACCVYAVPKLQKQKQYSITVSVLPNANIQREDDGDNMIDLEYSHGPSSYADSKQDLSAPGIKGASVLVGESAPRSMAPIDVKTTPHDPESNLQVKVGSLGILGSMKDWGKKAAGSLADFANKANELSITFESGSATIFDKDYPFACLCDKNGLCIQNLISKKKDPQDAVCFKNAGFMPDSPDNDESFNNIASMVYATCSLGMGVFLMVLVKIFGGEEPDLLPKRGGGAAEEEDYVQEG